MVYSLPGAPNVISTSLSSIPVSQYTDEKNTNTSSHSEDAAKTSEKPAAGKSTAAKRGKKNKAKQGVDGKSDGIGSFGIDKLEMGEGVGGGARGFLGAFISSDSECSDIEGVGGPGGRVNASNRSKVRLNALGCFHVIIKV